MGTIQVKGRHYRSYPAGSYLGYEELVLALDTANTAFVIVDVYGASPEGGDHDGPGLGYMLPKAWEIVSKRIVPSKAAAKRLGIPCIYVTNSAPRIELSQSAFGKQRYDNVNATLDDLFGESINDPLEYVRGDSRYIQHAPDIAPADDDYYVRKHVYSGFFETRLDSLLHNLGTRDIVFCGFTADICLLCTMIDALYRGYRVLLLRDCTQAVEIPEADGFDGRFTDRICLWAECHLGHTFTSSDWVVACEAATPNGADNSSTRDD
jgi:nicotinamidase-related amidase